MSFDGTEVKFFRQVSEALNEVGISTLRYDKRGVAQSTGDDAGVHRR
jgi:alpha/beta superfamily hydrolase